MAKRQKPIRPKSNEQKRISMGLPPRDIQKILIVSEGEVEKSYFIKINSLFRRKALEIQCVCSDLGTDALSVVDSTILERKKCLAEGDDIKSAWSVFDVDKNTPDKIQQALNKAKKNKINVCISNICFEIWMLMHDDSYSTASIIDGDAAKSLVKRTIIKNYDSSQNFFQNNPEIFEELMNKKDIAIKNSEKLDKFHNQEFPEEYNKGYLIKYNRDRNPSTHVYKLIKEIFELLDKEIT